RALRAANRVAAHKPTAPPAAPFDGELGEARALLEADLVAILELVERGSNGDLRPARAIAGHADLADRAGQHEAPAGLEVQLLLEAKVCRRGSGGKSCEDQSQTVAAGDRSHGNLLCGRASVFQVQRRGHEKGFRVGRGGKLRGWPGERVGGGGCLWGSPSARFPPAGGTKRRATWCSSWSTRCAPTISPSTATAGRPVRSSTA